MTKQIYNFDLNLCADKPSQSINCCDDFFKWSAKFGVIPGLAKIIQMK